MIGRPIAQPCGTRAAYSRGCHCPACVAANKAYHRQQRRGAQRDIPMLIGPPMPGLWVDQAACRGSDVREFFPARGANLEPLRVICRACPVHDECLRWALDAEIVDGFWGGMSARARRNLRVQAGHAHPAQFVWLVFLAVFIIIGLRLLGLAV